MPQSFLKYKEDERLWYEHGYCSKQSNIGDYAIEKRKNEGWVSSGETYKGKAK
jgi:hypothetical protein